MEEPPNEPGSGQSDRPSPPLGNDEIALRRRVSDREREDVAELLRESAADGRLTFVELEERLETVNGAKTYGELVEVTADLPNGLAQPSAEPVPATPVPHGLQPASSAINVFLSDSKRTGQWLAPQKQDVHAVLGDVTLDYTEAHIPYAEVFVDIKAILADVKIRVPNNAIVHLDGQPILGSISEQGSWDGAEPSAERTVFHIRGTAILGDIKVKRGPGLAKRLGLR